MGIKTRFNPLGGRSGSTDLGNLSLWRYSNDVISGKTLLYNYTGSWNTNLYAWDFNSYSTVLYTKSVAPSDYWGIFYYANGSQRPIDEFMGSLINDSALQIYSGGSMTVKLGVAYRNPVEDIQGTLLNGILYVPKAGGKAIINDWYNSTSSGMTDATRNTPFFNNLNVVNVDFQGVPFRDNRMHNTFYNCTHLTSVNNIPSSVTNMHFTFLKCYNLNQNIQIPNSVTSMCDTFQQCFNLNQNIRIPNSVTNMVGTFIYCLNLNQNIQIPNSVTNMYDTFSSCRNLKQSISNLCRYHTNLVNAHSAFSKTGITSATDCFYSCHNLVNGDAFANCNSLTTMFETFSHCYNLNSSITIPDSVTVMFRTFDSCYNLNSYIAISDSVTDMRGTFDSCYNLNQNIKIGSSVTDMAGTFENCTSLNQNIQIPNSVTDMRGTFDSCYNLNQNIKIGSSVTDMAGTFQNCTSLNQNIQIPKSVTDMSQTFYNCWNLPANYIATNRFNGTNCPRLTTIYYGFYNTPLTTVAHGFRNSSTLSNAYGAFMNCNSLTNMYWTFAYCPQLKDVDLKVPYNVTQLGGCFANSNNIQGNITIHSPKITNIVNTFRGYKTSLRKDIYIYFKYANGVNSATYNQFKANKVYKGTSGNGASVDPLYNSTSNFYVHNLGTAPF